MNRLSNITRVFLISLVMVLTVAVVDAQWPPKEFKNLKVLPKDIPPHELTDMMRGFTGALGVRCNYCHVGEDHKPLSTYDFASDDKVTKRKARVMMKMVKDLNDNVLSSLEQRAEPAVRIQCVTCHHGVTVPRTLEEVLVEAHRAGGVDSTVAAYRSLRKDYYGQAAYDFGPGSLMDVAEDFEGEGNLEDAVAVNALNVEMNPDSEWAKMQHVSSALLLAFQSAGADAGKAEFDRLSGLYGEAAFPERLLNRVGYTLLQEGETEAAIGAFQLCVDAYPESANAYDSLGDAYVANGDRVLAVANYEKALTLEPMEATKEKLEKLQRETGDN